MNIVYKTIIPSLLFIASHLCAQTIEFVFFNGTELSDLGSNFDNQVGSVSQTTGSITLTAEAFLDGISTGTALNGGADGFGINSQGTGDQTQRIDNINGFETFVFSFNTAGTLQSINLRYIEEVDNEAILSFENGNSFNLNTSTALSGEDDFFINETFLPGQEISLRISEASSLGENFALDSITIAIPENSVSSLWMSLFSYSILLGSRLIKK